MLKRTITYKDLDGNPITEDFFFHLSKPELAELALGEEGGLENYLRRIIAAKDAKAMLGTFKQVIMMAVGLKSPDGRRFIKSEQISLEFSQTDAYSVLFMELIADGEKAAAFVRAIVPSDMSEKLPDAETIVNTPLSELMAEPRTTQSRPQLNREQLSRMTPEEIAAWYNK